MNKLNDNFVHIDLNNFIDLIEKASNIYSEKIKDIIIYLDKALFEECFIKIDSFLNGMSGTPSEYKIGGAITFWIRKLKPLSFKIGKDDSNPDIFLNEKIAVIYGYNYIKAVKEKSFKKFIPLSASFLKDLAVQLRYSSFSPSSIAFLFEAIYIGKK